MLNTITLSFFTFLSLFSYSHAGQSDHVTYEWLINTAQDDHIPHWRRLFSTMPVRGFLECGCGFSTAYFMDHAEHVISIEYVTPGYGDKWYQECLLLYSDRTNWTPVLYNSDFRSNSFNNASAYQCSMHQDYALIDATYLKELYQHFKTQINKAHLSGYDIDVAFVHPGLFLRGDMIKLLLAHKIPIVAAHDTASDAGTDEKTNLYGWNKVFTPPNYVKIYIPFGKGTTFWISDQLPAVIHSMQEYQNAIIQLNEQELDINDNALTEIADNLP